MSMWDAPPHRKNKIADFAVFRAAAFEPAPSSTFGLWLSAAYAPRAGHRACDASPQAEATRNVRRCGPIEEKVIMDGRKTVSDGLKEIGTY
jgi:hypothetical protein